MGQYILYKGVFIFFIFFHGKKLLYIHIYVCVNKKKKKNEKVFSRCSQNGTFSREMVENRIFIFFLDGRKSDFYLLRGANTRKRGSAGAGTYP